MKKTVVALVAVATVAADRDARSKPAQRRAASRPYYGPPPVYVAEPPPPPPYGCYWHHQRYWDGYYGVWRVRPVRVCD